MRRFVVIMQALVALAVLNPAYAEAPAKAKPAGDYEPSVGQAGKDVVWVPTPDALVEKMLDMGKVTEKDYVMDLGSGDGRIAIAAAKSRGARAVGIEYNPDMVKLSNRKAKEAGVADKVKFIKADLFETDLSKADVITMYLLPRINMQLRPKLLSLKPGTRIVSHAFDMGEWKSDDTATIEGREAFLWIVPAKVGGNWRVSYPEGGGEPAELALTQNFQLVWGELRRGTEATELGAPWLSGDKIRFAVRDSKSGATQWYKGQIVDGNRMEGVTSAENAAAQKWIATRVQ